jgi:hypothetical protein
VLIKTRQLQKRQQVTGNTTPAAIDNPAFSAAIDKLDQAAAHVEEQMKLGAQQAQCAEVAVLGDLIENRVQDEQQHNQAAPTEYNERDLDELLRNTSEQTEEVLV